MIIVTGASGKLGQLIVQSLLSRVSDSEVGVSVREPEKASDLQRRGVRVRHGDFAQPGTLSQAFAGAAQLMIISSNAAAFGGDPLAQHRSAIQAAQEAGVRRIVYTSHMAASSASAFPPMWTHAATETLLAESGLAWTSLRNGFYADAALRFMGDDWQTGSIKVPADGKVAWTSHSDLAEAAAAILTGAATFNGPTPPLTGQQALDLGDLARLASSVQGRSIKRQVLDDTEFRHRLRERGLPEVVADMTLGFYEASRRGEFASIDPTLEELIGHPPTTMLQIIEESMGHCTKPQKSYAKP